MIYSNSTCSVEVGSATASSTSLNLILSLSSEGTYSFYHVLVQNGQSSECLSLGLSYTYDATRPGVTIEQASGQSDPVTALPVDFTVTFSEAIDASTFSTADINDGGTASGITWAIVDSGDHKIFTLTASIVTNNGTLRPSINANTVTDLASNQNTASTSSDNQVTVNQTRTLYLRASGSDGHDADTALNNPNLAYQTAQGVVDAVSTLNSQPSAGDPLIIDVGVGSFGDIILSGNFGQYITWRGVSEATSIIGNINGQGGAGAAGTGSGGTYDSDLGSCIGQYYTAAEAGGDGRNLYLTSNRSVTFGIVNLSGGQGGAGNGDIIDCLNVAVLYSGAAGAQGGSAGALHVRDAKVGTISLDGGPGGAGGWGWPSVSYSGGSGGTAGQFYAYGNSELASVSVNGGSGGDPGSVGSGGIRGAARNAGGIELNDTSSILGTASMNAGFGTTGGTCVNAGWLYLNDSATYGSLSAENENTADPMCVIPIYSYGGVCREGALSSYWTGSPNLGSSTFSLSVTDGGSGYYSMNQTQGTIDTSNYNFSYSLYSGLVHGWSGANSPLTIIITDAACSNMTTTLTAN